MRDRLQRLWDRQVGIEEYLPGTPGKRFSILDSFPYHTWGRCNAVSNGHEGEGVTDAERRFRESDAVRRRQFPGSFEEACAYGNFQAVVLMWSQGLVDIPTRQAIYEGNNASALMWAAFKGHLSIVRFLVDHGAPLEVVNTLGHTALQWAITAGHSDVVRFLLDRGADPSHKDRQGFDAAFSAVQNDRLALLLMLTEDAAREGHLLPTSDHGDVFYQPSTAEERERARTSLNPRTKKPYFLLDPHVRDVEGHTLMHWAAYRNSPATCQYLIDHWGYEADARDKHGRTPLVWAAREGFAEVLELLLSRGADRTSTDSDGWTALKYARIRNHPEAVYVLEFYPTTAAAGMGEDGDGGATTAAASLADTANTGKSEPESAGVFGEGDEPLNSASAALLGQQRVRDSSNGQRYICVRERRNFGTWQMLRTHSLFTLQAVCGPLYLLLAYVLMNVLPPLTSYFPFGIYFFKNVVWTALTPAPTQSSRQGPAPSPIKQMGIAANIADSARGTWLYRLRDPANLFVWLSFLGLQVWAWNSLGLPPLFSSGEANAALRQRRDAQLWGGDATPVAASSTSASATQVVHSFGLSFLRFITFQSNPLNDIITPDGATADPQATAHAVATFVAQSESYIRTVLMLLLVATLACVVLCKSTATRAVMTPPEEGTLRTSPLWRIVRARQYRWLHPRFFFQERHLQLPLRAFYCHERDVVVRGYDGYSILLDCPIGASNRLFFVLALTFFVCFEFFLFIWGLQQTRARLQCPARVGWYADAFYAFQSTEAMRAGLQARDAVIPRSSTAILATAATTTAAANPFTMATAGPAVALTAAAPVVSFAWLNTGMEVLLHGLPCRQHTKLETMTREFLEASHVAATSTAGSNEPQNNTEASSVSSVAGYIRRVLFLFQYYLWPTRAGALGLWVLHYSFLSLVSLGVIAVRQWRGVWHGVTRIELANPLVQGSDGHLVSLFPKDAQQAQRVTPVNAEEERYYAVAAPEAARSLTEVPQEGSQSLFSEGNGLVNVVAFLSGRLGRRWRGAMAVSVHNTPVMTPMLM